MIAIRGLVGQLRGPLGGALGGCSVQRAAGQNIRRASLYRSIVGAGRARQWSTPHGGQGFGAFVQREHRAPVRGGSQAQIVVDWLQPVRRRGWRPAAPAGRSGPPGYRHVPVSGHHGRDRGAREAVRRDASVVRQGLERGWVLVRGRAVRGRGRCRVLTRKTSVVGRRGRLAGRRCASATGKGQKIGRVLPVAAAPSAA